jgi:hypothetical protein
MRLRQHHRHQQRGRRDQHGDDQEQSTPADDVQQQAAGERRQYRRDAEHQVHRCHQARGRRAAVQVADDRARDHRAGAGADTCRKRSAISQ